MTYNQFFEEIHVMGRDLVDKVRGLIHEGNVRRVIIKDDRGHTFIEIPVTFAAIGIVASPILAAVAALSVMFSKFTVVVERTEPQVPVHEDVSGEAPRV